MGIFVFLSIFKNFLPCYPALEQYFVRAMFDYQPDEDNLLPCRDIGLTFKHGDILEVSRNGYK